MIDTFLPVYAALRLTGPSKPTLSGAVARGLVLVAVSPLIAFVLIIHALVWMIDRRRRLTAAQIKVRANQAAFQARQATKPQGFAGHVAELRKTQGEQP